MGTAGHIFHKGSEKYDDKGIAAPNNGPGLYLDKDKNALIVKMNTFPCAPGTPESTCIGGNVMEEEVMVNDIYDLSPNGIIKTLELQKPKFEKTAEWGHMGTGQIWG